MLAWDSRYLPELESEMRSVLDIDMSFFGFEVCINFVRMRLENVPHFYFWHTAIGIQNQKCSPPPWRRGSGLDFGPEDPGSIPRLPSPRVGPSDGKEVKDVFGRPGARVEVGSAR